MFEVRWPFGAFALVPLLLSAAVASMARPGRPADLPKAIWAAANVLFFGAAAYMLLSSDSDLLHVHLFRVIDLYNAWATRHGHFSSIRIRNIHIAVWLGLSALFLYRCPPEDREVVFREFFLASGTKPARALLAVKGVYYVGSVTQSMPLWKRYFGTFCLALVATPAAKPPTATGGPAVDIAADDAAASKDAGKKPKETFSRTGTGRLSPRGW